MFLLRLLQVPLVNDIDLINFEHFLSMDLKILMFSEFFAFLSKLFQTTGPLKNKDCLPNSVIVLF